jgi:hypothetical protein
MSARMPPITKRMGPNCEPNSTAVTNRTEGCRSLCTATGVGPTSPIIFGAEDDRVVGDAPRLAPT